MTNVPTAGWMESSNLTVGKGTEGGPGEGSGTIQDNSYACKEPPAGEPGSPTSTSQDPNRSRSSAEVLPQIELQKKIIQAFANRINSRSGGIEKMIKGISDDIQYIGKALQSFHHQALRLQTDNEKLTRENGELRQKMSELKVLMSKQEAFSRGLHLGLHGVAEDSSEDVGEKAREVCKALVPEEEKDRVAAEVDDAHRLGLLKAGGDPRPIIIRFTSRASRELTRKHAEQSDFLLSRGFRLEENVGDEAAGRRGWLEAEMAGEEDLTNPNVRQEERDQDGELFVCEVCGETCPDNDALSVHVRGHEKKFLCFICGKLYGSSHTLNTHLKGHLKPRVCEICGKALHSYYRLNLHKKIHTGEPYRCEICGLGLLQRYSLLNHMRIHTGERPFPCPTCGKRFHSISRLSQHKRTHSAIKPFGCGSCKKRFRERNNLIQHQKIHTRERQSRDGVPSARSSSEKERLYRCDVCGKRFCQKRYVPIHMRIHTGEKPFVCSQCGTGFTQKGSLKVHMEMHRRRVSKDGCLSLHSKIHNKE
uniref:C2H2-type domain-containing protein n=1 Tax=Nothobranchius furzeri TaxID=105023 RepID=A0A1A8UIU6_NOTFU